VQRLLCHFHLFSQIVHLKKATRKRIFFSALSGYLHEDLRKFNYCWRHKFIIKALLCKTKLLYIVDSDVYLTNTHRIYCVSTAKMLKRTRHSVRLHILPEHSLLCFKLLITVSSKVPVLD